VLCSDSEHFHRWSTLSLATQASAAQAPLGRPIVIFGHIRRSYIRNVSGMIVANPGSVSLSYDGDRRAAYLLLDGMSPAIRRVEYDVEKELKALSECSLPHADWMARTLKSGTYQPLRKKRAALLARSRQWFP
jgi:hypothetical protein